LPDPFYSIRGLDDITVEYDVSMAEHTTWGVGGPARYLVTARSKPSLVRVLRVVRERELPLFIMGNGSNLLIADGGVPGVIIRLTDKLANVSVSGEQMEAGAGASISNAVTTALHASLTGFEFAFGIPGTVGGAIMTNAAAFRGSIAGVLTVVKTLTMDVEEERHVSFDAEYREPLVPPGEVVIKAKFSLSRDHEEAIKKRMDEVRSMRRETQPWGMRTAGSVFKNPPGDSAGRLIEECGLKGKGVGGARISEIHANFIINGGDATASDIKRLIDLARGEVGARFGVDMELEVQMLGLFGE